MGLFKSEFLRCKRIFPAILKNSNLKPYIYTKRICAEWTHSPRKSLLPRVERLGRITDATWSTKHLSVIRQRVRDFRNASLRRRSFRGLSETCATNTRPRKFVDVTPNHGVAITCTGYQRRTIFFGTYSCYLWGDAVGTYVSRGRGLARPKEPFSTRERGLMCRARL